MANIAFKFSKIRHYGNKSWLDGKNLNASIYLCEFICANLSVRPCDAEILVLSLRPTDRLIANFACKLSKFRCYGNKGWS